MTARIVTRRGMLGGGAALLPGAALAQQAAPTPVPPMAPAVPPASAPPPAPANTARPAAPQIDKTKAYYLFFDTGIDANTMRALRRQMTTLVEAGVTDVTLVMSSTGGLLDPMFEAYTFLRALPITFSTHAQGFVQSAATVLFLAGEHRSADRYARFLFHPTATALTGGFNGVQLQERLQQIRAAEDMIGFIYQDRTHLTPEQVRSFTQREVIYDADQALQAGVVDQVADLRLPGEDKARIITLD